MRFWTTAAIHIGVITGLLAAGGHARRESPPRTLALKAPDAGAGRFPTARDEVESRAPIWRSSSSWWLLALGIVIAGSAWAGLACRPLARAHPYVRDPRSRSKSSAV